VSLNRPELRFTELLILDRSDGIIGFLAAAESSRSGSAPAYAVCLASATFFSGRVGYSLCVRISVPTMKAKADSITSSQGVSALAVAVFSFPAVISKRIRGTRDCQVRAHVVGIALGFPRPIVQVAVHDNQEVQKGESDLRSIHRFGPGRLDDGQVQNDKRH